MNRRNFFKSCGLVVFVGSSAVVGQSVGAPTKSEVFKTKDFGGWNQEDKVGKTLFTVSNTIPDKLFERKSNGEWKFYINGEEVESNRALDEYGCLHWPFKGTKYGDICKAQSPTMQYLVRGKCERINI